MNEMRRSSVYGSRGRIYRQPSKCENCFGNVPIHKTACLRRYDALINKPYTAPRLSKATKEIVERAIEAILAHPETVDMEVWLKHFHPTFTSKPEEEDGYCGTTACLAGHIGIAAGLPPKDYNHNLDILKIPALSKIKVRGIRTHIAEIAEQLLKLKTCDRERVFIWKAWPRRFRRRYAAGGDMGRARATADRLRHYLTTGE